MKLYWRHKKEGKWTFTAYEGFDDVYNLRTLVRDLSTPGTIGFEWGRANSACVEMMYQDYLRVLEISGEEE